MQIKIEVTYGNAQAAGGLTISDAHVAAAEQAHGSALALARAMADALTAQLDVSEYTAEPAPEEHAEEPAPKARRKHK